MLLPVFNLTQYKNQNSRHNVESLIYVLFVIILKLLFCCVSVKDNLTKTICVHFLLSPSDVKALTQIKDKHFVTTAAHSLGDVFLGCKLLSCCISDDDDET